jgi:YVTN family beta-propeller protein
MRGPLTRGPRLLDRYWAALMRDRSARPPAGLDADLAELAVRMAHDSRALNPPQTFIDQLGRRLVAEASSAPRPDGRRWAGPALDRRHPSSPDSADTASREIDMSNIADRPQDVPIPLHERRWPKEALKIAAAAIVFGIVGAVLVLALRGDDDDSSVVSPVETPTPVVTPSVSPSAAPAVTPTAAAVAPTAIASPSPTATLPPAGEVVATIPTGNGPRSILITEDAVWVTNTEDNTVARIDPATNQVVATIAVGEPGPVAPGAFTSDGVAAGEGSVWVATDSQGQQYVVRIDPATNEVVARIPIDRDVYVLAVAGGAVWARGYPNDVLRIDPVTNSQVATIPVDSPFDLVAADGAVLVPTVASSVVLRIDAATNAVSELNPVGDSAITGYWLDGGTLWLSTASDIVHVDLATNQVIASFPIPENVQGSLVAVSEDAVWVTAGPDSLLWKLDRDSGEALGSVPLPDIRDLRYRDGSFWMTGLDNTVVRIDVEP